MRFVGVGVVVAGVLILGGSAWANAANHGAASPTGSQELLTWDHEAPVEGPVQLIVSVPEQRIDVYVGAELVAGSPVSTGRQGYPTPTGVFSILQKRKFHRSNIYSRTPMPFMQRLTWSGIALHASNDVPEHPASHGCIRLPSEFARKLFGFTEIGAHVIVSDGETIPVEIDHPNLFQPVPPQRHASATAHIGIDGSQIRSVRADGAPSETAPSAGEATSGTAPPRDIGAAAGPPTTAETRNESPVRVLVTRRTGRELLRDVQTLLKGLGFDPGELDGWMGRNTGRAVARFQESRGLQRTGAMSSELVTELYRAAGKGKPPTGHIYVRQDFEPVFDASIAIAEPEDPLGTYLFTATHLEEDAAEARWLAVSLNDESNDTPTPGAEGEEAADARVLGAAKEALDRIGIPASVRRRISEMLTPGSSLAITDQGISRETIDKGTDFIVLTR